MSKPSWGIVSTIKAPARDILNFIAYHLHLGAEHLWIYLDEDSPVARDALQNISSVTVTVTDATYWDKRGRRPVKHQVRQTTNATRTLRRLAHVDWLAHIDVDEYLWPDEPISEILSRIAPETNSLRVRAVEAMAPHPDMMPPDGTIWYKGCALQRQTRIIETDEIYPTYGRHLNGGFMSHVEGKIFSRTGIADARLRIHNLFIGDTQDPAPQECPTIRLCHHHGMDVESWLAKLPFRLERGSYRPDMKPVYRPDGPGMSMNELLSEIAHQNGEAGLRAFYDAVCTAHPDLCARLARYSHLHRHDLSLEEHRIALFGKI